MNELTELQKLFVALRAKIEPDLQELASRYPDKISECPSQKLRTLQCLEQIRKDLALLVTPGQSCTTRRKLRRYESRLTDFLAVHRAIGIKDDVCCDHWKTEEELRLRAEEQERENSWT